MIIHPTMIEKRTEKNKYEDTIHRGVYPGTRNKLRFNGESFQVPSRARQSMLSKPVFIDSEYSMIRLCSSASSLY